MNANYRLARQFFTYRSCAATSAWINGQSIDFYIPLFLSKSVVDPVRTFTAQWSAFRQTNVKCFAEESGTLGEYFTWHLLFYKIFFPLMRTDWPSKKAACWLARCSVRLTFSLCRSSAWLLAHSALPKPTSDSDHLLFIDSGGLQLTLAHLFSNLTI